jgi:hypothetical protein
MFPLPASRHRAVRRMSARRPLVEDLEGRRLLSGSNIHHHPGVMFQKIVISSLHAPASEATQGGSGGGGGAGKVRFNESQALQLQAGMQNENRQFTVAPNSIKSRQGTL